MSFMTVNLGNIDLSATQVTECADCGSRNIISVKGEPDQEKIAAFVRSRAGRLGLTLENYTISVSPEGAVTAEEKAPAKLDIHFA